MGNCVTTQEGLECIDIPLYPITAVPQPLVTTTTTGATPKTSEFPRTGGSDNAETWAFIAVALIVVGVVFVLVARNFLYKWSRK